MIWNDGIIAAHAGWFLNSCLLIERTWNNRLVTAQLELKQTELLLNRQQILHPKTWEQADSKGVAMIHLDFAFYTSHLLLSFGFCIVQNRASCCCCPVTKFCLSICEPMYSCTSGFPVLHCLPEFAQTRPLSWWCHPTTWSSVVSFSSCPQSYVPPIRKGN